MNSKLSNYKLSAEQIRFLELELKAYAKNPKEGSSWGEIRERIKNSRDTSKLPVK